MKILVHFPTRSRPHKFLEVLSRLNNLASDKENIFYLISVDSDDYTMQDITTQIGDMIPFMNISIEYGQSNNKIHACNRDMETTEDWDITMLMSDDMIPQVEGWDDILRFEMKREFPDLDGVLWHYDGYQDRISTLCIMGKTYWDRFGYFYHEDYISLWADNEFTEVAKGLDKLYYSDQCLFKHEHCMNNNTVLNDALYKRNEPFYHIDQQTYERRKEEGFPS